MKKWFICWDANNQNAKTAIHSSECKLTQKPPWQFDYFSPIPDQYFLTQGAQKSLEHKGSNMDKIEQKDQRNNGSNSCNKLHSYV